METVKVLEPRVNVKADEEKNHVVLYGSLRTTEQINVADSFNTQQALWTINPPSTTTITDRLVKIRAYIQVQADQDLQLGTNDALRQLPISSITDVITVQINGETISDNLGDKLHAMLCFGNDRSDRVKSWSTSPCMPDNYQQYSDWTLYGSAKNPLAEYGENNGEDPRGGFPVDILDSKTFRAVLTEPILLSPFYSGIGQQEEGFVNVNQFNISFRWKSDLSRIMSHSTAGNPITSYTVTFYQAPEILTTFLTPDLTQPIPTLQTLPYHKPQEYIKTVQNVQIGELKKYISDSVKLSQIPRRAYLFVKKSRGTSTFTDPNSFYRIENLSVLWNNQSGLFSSASEQDLYEISRRNGSNLSWSQWHQYRGSVMCIEFGKDIGLLDNEAPGVQGQYTIQVQMDARNLSGEIQEVEFYLILLFEGTIVITENSARTTLGNLTPDLVLRSKESEEMHYGDYDKIEGGGFFNKLKHSFSKISRGVQSVGKRALDVAEKLTPVATAAFPELAPLTTGLPIARRLIGGRLSGGELRAKESKGKMNDKRMKRPKRRLN